MTEYKFVMPDFDLEFDFTPGQLEAMQIKLHPLISDWLEDNISLTGGYLKKGPFKLDAWQRQVVNSPLYYDEVYWLGPTRTGKSLLSESVAYYCQGEMKVDGILVYPENTTAEHRFSETLKPMIEHNLVLRNQWNGDEKYLTVKRLRLNNCTWRVASAQNKNDIASFSAPVGICSEVGKWEKQKKFNPKQLIKGRQQDSHHTGFQKLVFETTPFEVGDYMYQEVYQDGVIILHPHWPCPHCGNYHEYTDDHIKLRDEKYKSANLIRKNKEKAVFYECPNCKQEISEADRAAVNDYVVWAAPEIIQDDFKQNPEKINHDGTIDGVLENGYRPWALKICHQWNRAVDINYTFWKWLGDFFECKDDPVKLKSYHNEVNARYFSSKTSGTNVAYIQSKIGGYNVKGDGVVIPDDVLVVTLGIDTHDDNFTYAYVGWCYGVSWKILKHGKIPCDMKLQEFKDPVNVFVRLQTELNRERMYWNNGIPVVASCTFQDRGGHRAKDVDYICSKMYNHFAYVGLTRVDQTKEPFYESNNGNYYLGQTEVLSDLTGMKINSDDFCIPDDYLPELPRELARQFFIKKLNPDGKTSRIWIHGGDDHYRDCLNLNECAGRKIGLHTILTDKEKCDTLYRERCKIAEAAQIKTAVKTEQHKPQHSSQHTNNRYGGSPRGGYNRVFGRR